MDNLPILDKYGYILQYPSDASVFAFESNRERKGLAIRIQREALLFKIVIEPFTEIHPLEQIAREEFNRQPQALLIDDVPPYEFQTTHSAGWRFRKVFIDGFQVPFLQETVLLHHPSGMVRVQMTAAPSQFLEALPEFEIILQSLIYQEVYHA